MSMGPVSKGPDKVLQGPLLLVRLFDRTTGLQFSEEGVYSREFVPEKKKKSEL